MSEEYYTKDGINKPEDYDDGGWRSATMKHRIWANTDYDNIYNNYEDNINYYRDLAYKLTPFLSDKNKKEIENYYYTNQELTLEERTLVEDILMEAITNKQYDGEFSYKDKVEFDKNQ